MEKELADTRAEVERLEKELQSQKDLTLFYKKKLEYEYKNGWKDCLMVNGLDKRGKPKNPSCRICNRKLNEDEGDILEIGICTACNTTNA